MTAFNVVRFRVKSGREKEFIEAHKAANPRFSGMRRFSMFNTGPGTYCIVGEWTSIDDLAAARSGMIGMLDRFRHMLEDLGGGLGVTDPVSGSTVLDIAPRPRPRAKQGKARKKIALRIKPKAPKAKKDIAGRSSTSKRRKAR